MSNSLKFFRSGSTGRIVALIGCVGLSCSTRLIASSTVRPSSPAVVGDSIKRLLPAQVAKPILFTEEGARAALRFKAEALASRDMIALKDSLLSVQRGQITEQNRQITRLNRQQQGKANDSQQAQSQADDCRTKLRAARLERWAWRIGAVALLAAKLKLI